MKLLNKFTNIMLAAIMAISMVGFSSCNDHLNDEMTDINSSFTKEVEDLQDQINDLKTKICTCTCTHDHYTKGEVDALVTDLQNQLDQAKSDIKTNSDSIIAIKGRLEAAIAANTAAIASLVADTSIVHATLRNIQNTIADLQEDVAAVIDSAAAANALARWDSARIVEIQKHDTLQDLRLDTLESTVDSLCVITQLYLDSALNFADSLYQLCADSLVATNLRIDDLKAYVDSIAAEHQDQLDSLRSDVDSIFVRLDTIETRLDNLEERMIVVEDIINKAVYSLELNGTTNPVFGYFTMPFDVQSNMLLAYYGTTSLPIEFPTQSDPYGSVVPGSCTLTAAEAANLNMGAFTEAGGSVLVSETAGAGKIYFFVNPGEVEINENYNFTLVNSLGQESPIKLDTVVPCDEVLYAGMYKAPGKEKSPYSFYVAPAVLGLGLDGADLADAAEEAEFNINAGALKQTAKDFYNQYVKRQGSDASFTTLAANLASLLVRPAQLYALRVEWPDTLGNLHSTKSAAKITANSVKPLSFAALQDVNFPNIPNITPISELEDFNFNMNNMHFNINFNLGNANANIHLSNITLDFAGVNVTVEVPEIVGGTWTGNMVPATVNIDDLKTYFNTNFNSSIDGWNTNINAEINSQIDALVGEINAQVHAFSADLEGQLNTQIGNVFNDVNSTINDKMHGLNSYIQKANKLIARVNAAINRINGKLQSPNQFLQVCMFYEANDQFHFLSNSKSVPSVFNCSGSTGAIQLYPTTYNAEIIAPAFKKFVAVTNAWSNATGAEAAAQVTAANSQDGMNEVIEGGHNGIAFVGQKGYTYEIFYSALDYSGKISQRKFYVTVK